MVSIFLSDGTKLYQWDSNRQIQIIGSNNIEEVHFCHRNDKTALVVKPVIQNNFIVADIPNVLLQSSEDIVVYLYAEERTIKEQVLRVQSKNRPDDYVYEQTEILRYETLDKRLTDLEETLINSPQTAKVGQLLSVKSVDENGKPTEWETMVPYATDISKTPGYQKTATTQQIIIDISNPFSLGLYFSSSLLTYFKIMNGDQKLNKYILTQPRLIEFTKISATDVIFVFYYRTQQVAQYHYSVNSNSWEEKILNYAAASINSKLNEKISNPLTASVGQILEVEEIDENGKPTKWKAVDKPTGEDVDLYGIWK